VEVEANHESDDDSGENEYPLLEGHTPPCLVKAVPRLIADVEVMLQLTVMEAPPRRHVREIREISIIYCYRDASWSGFGWCIDFGGSVLYELGEWCVSIHEASSNFM
jgi:hypothetical protein